MAWTNVAKPTGTPYTKVHTHQPSYNESSISYDSSSDYYDGINQAAWTNISKPAGGGLLEVGMAFGTLGMTYSVQENASPWTLVNKPQ